MPVLDFSIVAPYTDLLLTGLWWTIVLAVASSALSFILGIVFALVVLYAPALFAYPVRFFMWLFMGTPLLLQLYLIYYGLVQIGIDIPALFAGILGLSLHFAVYNADVFRAGIVSVDPGQTEGARSIGLSQGQTLRYIIIPQAIRNTIPPIGNNMIVLLKDTSLVSIIGIAELVHSAQIAISETYSPFEFYLTAAALYYVVNLIMEAGLRHIERKVEVTR
ncbi:amino acid ABC transporter permease [Ochrobactrum teleogrylli]|uniref:Amino acid ABC transporter permease n=1 Tax=Ochrobactrum teleogrylli TaxID=2479765 RepID=A0ABD5JSX6_9HYPH